MQAVTPITQANGVQVIFASLTGDILLDALIGAMFAIISYSSLAAVLLTATLTAAGIISFPVALCLVIGLTSVPACWRCSTTVPPMPQPAVSRWVVCCLSWWVA